MALSSPPGAIPPYGAFEKPEMRIRFRPTAALWLSAEPEARADVPLQLSVAKRAKAAALPPLQMSGSEWTIFIGPAKMSHHRSADSLARSGVER